MELCKTRCLDCGYVHVWQAWKWVDSPERAAWNESRSTTCQKCGSKHVEDVQDDEVMAPYRFAASVVSGLVSGATPTKDGDKGT
jgi:hypothetical protein